MEEQTDNLANLKVLNDINKLDDKVMETINEITALAGVVNSALDRIISLENLLEVYFIADQKIHQKKGINK